MKDKTRKEHPSYGMLGFSRVHGGARTLFGSSIQHGDTIMLRLSSADVMRELNRDWYFGKKRLFEVEMSLSQFAELITSLNVGEGVPVTIRYTEEDGHIEEPPYENKYDLHYKEFKQHLDDTYAEARALIQDVEERFAQKKSLTKKEKEENMSRLHKISSNIGANMDFELSQFNEQMEKTVTEAKAEVEAFYQHRIMEAANGNGRIDIEKPEGFLPG